MEDDEERIVRNPGQMIDARDARCNPLQEGPGRRLLQDQVRKNFKIYADEQCKTNPQFWKALTPDEQFEAFKGHHHHIVLATAEERGWGAFGRE